MLSEALKIAPYATFFTLALAFLISLATNLVNRKFIDREKFGKWQGEINQWKADQKLAKKTGDKKLAAKVRKQEPHILQLQSRMAGQQTKTLLVTFVPMLLLWQVLAGFFSAAPIAFLPWLPGSDPFYLPFYMWYMVCTYFASTVISRILGVQPGAGMGMGLGQR